MLVIYPFSLPDQDQALKNARWIAELGSYGSHDIFVLSDRRCPMELVKEVVKQFTGKFNIVQHRWTTADIDGWPQGANHMFSYAAALIQHEPKWPCFLWLEPDAIPISPGWLDALEAEYRRGNKPFMGERVDLGDKRPDVPVHMSGVGIYQNPIYLLAGEAYRAHDVAWDIAAKDQILPHCHFTKLIQHYWRHGTFTHLNTIRPETVLFHSSKDGSLIDVLRNENLHTAGSPSEAQIENEALQKGLANQTPGGIQSDVSQRAEGIQGSQASEISGERRSGEGSPLRENYQAGDMLPMQDPHTAEKASRTPQGLQQTAGSDMAMRKMPLAGAQSGSIKKLRDGTWVLENDAISGRVMEAGRLDFDPLIPRITPLIRPGDTVVDVGAFIGDHTVAYSHAVGPSGKVLAYEPNPLAFQCLVHNTDGMANVFGFCRALGAQDGIAGLVGDNPDNYASHFISHDNKEQGPIVPVRRLDIDAALFTQIDLMKIDVEGYELNVLNGAELLIEKFHPKLVIEINEIALKRQNTTPEDVVGWVVRHGYEASVLHRHGPDVPFYDILALAKQPPEISSGSGPAHSESPAVAPPVAAPFGEATPQSVLAFAHAMEKEEAYKPTIREEITWHVEVLRAFCEHDPQAKAIVMQKLVYAGLRLPNKKTKHAKSKTHKQTNGSSGAVT